MFPCNVARATTTDVISGGMAGTINGALQLVKSISSCLITSRFKFRFNIFGFVTNTDECGATSFDTVGSGSQCQFPPVLQTARGGRVGGGGCFN